MEVLVSKEYTNLTHNLGGFSRKNVEENNVYFVKEEIISANIHFLNQTTVPISGSEPF